MLKNTIPFVDLRGKTPVDLLRAYPDKARALIRSTRKIYGLFSYVASALALPAGDRFSHRWLQRTGNPYLHEIESFADILNLRGVYALNLCYEWGCSSGAWRTNETISLLRVLDWPFPDLGRHVMVVLQSGKAGDFYNVTWPGTSGVFTAMAPKRFSGAINLAPMRAHSHIFALDWLKNRLIAGKENGIPPSHLLRQAFEKARTYEEARALLIKTPVAVPVIFVLAGVNPGEGCVIERLENEAEVFDLSADQCVHSANHFISRFAARAGGWHPRMNDSPGRFRQCTGIGGYDLEKDHFGWLQAPVINKFTRLCVIADATTGRLMVQGYEGSIPVTGLFNLKGAHYEDRKAI